MSIRLSAPGRLVLAAMFGFVFGVLGIGLLVLSTTNESRPCLDDILDAEVKVTVGFYEEATTADLAYLNGCGFE